MWQANPVGVAGPELLIFAVILAMGFVPLVLGIMLVVDAARYPEFAFERVGQNRTVWIVVPIVGVAVCGVITIVFAIWWYAGMKARVAAAASTP